MRKHAEESAKAFVSERFPDCRTAILGGSIVRGEGTAKSDLDIVVIDEAVESAYRESFHVSDWPVELFVHNLTSYKAFFKSDAERGRPSLPNMFAEGVVLQDDGLAHVVKQEAQTLLDKGPERWTPSEIRAKRYAISELLEDLEGSDDDDEDLFIVSALAEHLHEFVLRTNGCWIGEAKWIVRALRRYDEAFARKFSSVFKDFYRSGNKEEVIVFADEILKTFGSRLFDGFSAGKS
ncbi:MAG TPA: nucleotidyltransferase domain-containing protein [Bacillales bacterium]|nr:nucleotidyltransferase domain-containing protein [Bacillales bacterium]